MADSSISAPGLPSLADSGTKVSTNVPIVGKGTFSSVAPAFSFTGAETLGFSQSSTNAIYAVFNGTTMVFDFGSQNFRVPGTYQIGWAAGDPSGGAADTGFKRVAAGLAQVTNGGAGQGALIVNTFNAATVNINSAATDVATISGLPSKYILRRVILHTASGAVTTATLDLRTAAAGGGTALVSAFLLSGLSSTTAFVDATLQAAASANVRTETSLFVRCVTAEGSAKTISVTLEIQPLI